MSRIQGALGAAALCLAAAMTAGAHEVDVRSDVVYGHKDGLAMTYDVFAPREGANGAGVLFMVSGGWYSQWTPPAQTRLFTDPLTKRGYVVFAVRHGSSPRYGIPDAVSDVRRAVRHIRLNAADFKVDPERLGVYGMSAGGHLSLMLGTASDEGKKDDKDPVARVSDRVQAVTAYVAPTDLTIMVKGTPTRLPSYDKFPALDLDLAAAKDHSPLLHVTADDAPTLLLAGVKDDLVPIDHSRRIHQAFEERKVPTKLVEYPNSGHGLGPLELADSIAKMGDWFDVHLKKK